MSDLLKRPIRKRGCTLMAVLMCCGRFFGVLMWWQIKATRRFGNAILILKAVAAAESKMGTVIVGC